MATIQYRNIYASGVLGLPQDTRDRADRDADVCLSDRVAVVVITTNGDELPTFEVIDVRKPKPPTVWVGRFCDIWKSMPSESTPIIPDLYCLEIFAWSLKNPDMPPTMAALASGLSAMTRRLPSRGQALLSSTSEACKPMSAVAGDVPGVPTKFHTF